jgi:acyl-CoA reductase-like NAD-dependent aldehyde dehydrogenase
VDTQLLDHSIEALQRSKDAWAQLPPARKADYLDGILRRYRGVAARQVQLSNRAKGIEEGTPRSGEEWAQPYLAARLLRLLRDSLRQVAAHGRPRLPRGAVRTRPNGQLAARVFPLSVFDRMLFPGFRAEVWMQPGATEVTLAEPTAPGKVALVLGAGNVAGAGFSDLVHKLFVENQVCLFKHNPVTDYLAPILDEAFADLIRDGFLRLASGGGDAGGYLCRHPGIDEIHLTGSDRTYEAIVFGAGEEGRRRKAENRPLLTKRFTCELGNASPLIVVPGPWRDADIRFHAANIATQMVVNCGFNCLSSRVLVLARDWPRSADLMNALREVLVATPQRKAYYPGAEDRYDRVVAANPTAEPIGPRSPGVLPYTLVPGIDPAESANPCFASECFLPLLAQTSLPGASAGQFLENAVEFCNRTLWGTLSASILVHPSTRRRLGGALEQALEALRYGTVAVNQWTALGYMWCSPGWGAWPGHTPADIQSGIGVVHNTFLFDKPEKSVIHGPFRLWPTPVWFITSPRTHRVLPRLFELEYEPSLRKALGVAVRAVAG